MVLLFQRTDNHLHFLLRLDRIGFRNESASIVLEESFRFSGNTPVGIRNDDFVLFHGLKIS